MSPKARSTVRPLRLIDGASAEEQAHARGLNEGMLRKVNRIKQEVVKREALARKLVKKIGIRQKRIAELEALLSEALPNLDGYVIMAADQPGSLWSRIHAALTHKKE